MKATGIIRKMDDLGRVAIPKEIRKNLRLHTDDPMEIFLDYDGGVVFKKYDVGESFQELLESLEQNLSDISDDLNLEQYKQIKVKLGEIREILNKEVGI